MEMDLIDKYWGLMDQGELITTPDVDQVKSAFDALWDLSDMLPMHNPSFGHMYDGLRRVLLSAIYLHKSSIPDHLQEHVESADIDETLVDRPWEYVAYYEALASLN